MSDSVIVAEGLSKQYTLGGQRHDTLRDRITSVLRSRGAEEAGRDSFWALRDVSFEINRGDIVGVIGKNGAGKSTLLKILSRITEPTGGRVELRGRVGSLLEVGSGFHPELSGRDNVFLNGAILGMKRAEIQKRFDEIVAFSEIEKFIDTPVKRYSSGMYMRLAFAVAAHMETDVLIIDEVLAVGDAPFQKKCLGKIQSVSGDGRTVLFVSHNMQAISTLTSTALFLNRGTLLSNGPTTDVIRQYLQSESAREGVFTAQPKDDTPTITTVEVVTSEPGSVQQHGKRFEVRIQFSTPFAINNATVSFQIVNESESAIVHAWTSDSEQEIGRSPGVYALNCVIPSLKAYMGRYSLRVYLSEFYGGRRFDLVDKICPFDVVMYGLNRDRPWFPGTCSYIEDFSWSTPSLPGVPDSAVPTI